MCVCVCVCVRARARARPHTHTHTQNEREREREGGSMREASLPNGNDEASNNSFADLLPYRGR